MRCPSCNYENSAGDPSCNLCGAVLVVKLPKRTENLSRTALDDRIAAHRKTQRRKGLEEVRDRLNEKLERLNAVQTDSEVELLAHSKREETAYEDELRDAQRMLLENREVLAETEQHVRKLRRQVTALQFELRQAVEKKEAQLAGKRELGAELERLRGFKRALEGGKPADEAPEQGPGPTQDLEVKGLQAICVRLSERITLLNRQLQERDSYLHWLLLEGDPIHFRQRLAEIRQVDKELAERGDAADFLHWLRSSGSIEDVEA